LIETVSTACDAQADVVLRAVLRRWPGLRLAESSLRWNGIAGLRGLAALPVTAS
jgi:cytochrome P450